MPGLGAAAEAAGAGEDEDEDGGAGYLGLFAGLWGLNILSGSTVGLSQLSSGRGRLMKSSSSGTSRDREPIVRCSSFMSFLVLVVILVFF
jgi:hypothetical protein